MKNITLWHALQLVTFGLAVAALYLAVRPAPSSATIELTRGEHLRTTIEPGHIEISDKDGRVEIWGKAIYFRAHDNPNPPVMIQTLPPHCGSIVLHDNKGEAHHLGEFCRPAGSP